MPVEQELTLRWGPIHVLRTMALPFAGLVIGGCLLISGISPVAGWVLGVPSVLFALGLVPYVIRPWAALTLTSQQLVLHKVMKADVTVRWSEINRGEITHVVRVGPVLMLYLKSDAAGSRFAGADHEVALADLGVQPHEFAELLERYGAPRIRVDY